MKLRFVEDVYREIFKITTQQIKSNLLEENLRLLGEKNALDKVKGIKEEKLSSIQEAQKIVNVIENLENKKRISFLFEKQYKETHYFSPEKGYEYTGKLIIINDNIKKNPTLINENNLKTSKYISIDTLTSYNEDNKIIYEVEFNIKFPKDMNEGIYKEYIYTDIQGYKTQIFNIVLDCINKFKNIDTKKYEYNIKLYKTIHIQNFSKCDKIEVSNNKNLKIVYGEKILNTKTKNILYKIFSKTNLDIFNKLKKKISKLEQSIILINKNYFRKSNENNISKIDVIRKNKKIYEYKIYIENITSKQLQKKDSKPNIDEPIPKSTQDEINLDFHKIKDDLFKHLSKNNIDKYKIEDIIKDIKKLYNQNIFIDYIIFSKTIELLLDNDYFDDIEMLEICENYIYKNKLVDQHVYNYLKHIYLETSLYTNYTENVLKSMNIFSKGIKKSEDDLKIYINYTIIFNRRDIRFNENLKELCNILGEYKFVHDYCVKNAIDYINSPNNLNRNFMDNELLDIMVKVYENNTEHYRLLEAIIAGYLRIRSIEQLDFKYLERITEYYINSKVFDERSRHIATLIYKYKYNNKFSEELNKDFTQYLAEILKYEIVKCDESNIDNYITIATLKDNKKLKMDKCGLYAVNLGYSLEDTYKVINKNEELTKKRYYLRQNKSLFINEFKTVDDEEFRKLAVEICVNEEKYNENIKQILQYPLDNEDLLPTDTLLKNTYLFYFKNVLRDDNEDIEKIINYIEDFISKYKDEEDISKEFVDIIYKIETKNPQKAIETLAFICGEYEFDQKTISRIRTFISNNIDNDYNQELIYVFDNMGTYISDSMNQIIFKDYLKSLDIIEPQSSSIILKIFNKVIELDNKYFSDEIIAILLQKSVTESLINLLIQMDEIQKGKFTEQVYEKIENAYISRKVKFNNILLKHLIVNYKGTISKFKKICELVCKEQLSIDDYKLIYEKSLNYIDEDICEFKNILRLLDYTKAKEHLNGIDKVIDEIGGYFIKDIIKKGYYITVQKGLNKLNNEEVLIFKVMNPQLFNILADYIEEDEHIKQVYEKNSYYIIIENTKYLTEIQSNLDICDILKLFIKYIELDIEMLRYSYELPSIKIEDLIVTNNVILPMNISKITNESLISSTGIAKKDTINDRQYNYSNKDKDNVRVSNIKDCIVKVIKNKHLENNIEEFIYENIISNYKEDLSLFKEDLRNIIKNIKNIDSEDLNMKDAINNFEFLKEQQKQDVIKHIIAKDITSKNAYNNVLYYDEYEGLEKEIYLITNFDISMKPLKKIYTKIYNILEKNFINRESLDKDNIKYAYRFFAIGARYNLVKVKKYEYMINEIKFLDDLDKRSLLNLIQTNMDTSISKR